MARILVLELDPVFAAVVEDRLLVAGHEPVLTPDPAPAVSAATDGRADLLIMGTMGSHDLDEHGTHTSELVLRAACPVIAVPFGTRVGVPREIALVLGRDAIEDPSVLETLLHIALLFDAKVHVLTIYQNSVLVTTEEEGAGERPAAQNERRLGYYLEHFYVEHSFAENLDIEAGIMDYVREKGIDMLAIIPRNHAKSTEPSEGRLTKLLTLHADVPVLTLEQRSGSFQNS